MTFCQSSQKSRRHPLLVLRPENFCFHKALSNSVQVWVHASMSNVEDTESFHNQYLQFHGDCPVKQLFNVKVLVAKRLSSQRFDRS